jgi:3D (Asp-Asp-Asp) domain-containing protein
MAVNGQMKTPSFWTIVAVFCGMVIIPYYWIYAKVNIKVDGKVISVRTLDRRVADIMRAGRIQYGPSDIIDPELDQRLRPGQDIKIIRVAEKIIENQDYLPYTITKSEQSSRNLRPVEVQKGFVGKRWQQIKVSYHDQVEYNRQVIAEKTEKKPVHKLILKNSKGKVTREYDLTKVKSFWVVATSYYPYDPQCYPGGDGIHTRLGLELRRGFVAVDPRVIPLRTRLYIPGYGYAYAADTGSAIKGKRIDLAVDNVAECNRFGKRAMKVYVLDRAEKW